MQRRNVFFFNLNLQCNNSIHQTYVRIFGHDGLPEKFSFALLNQTGGPTFPTFGYVELSTTKIVKYFLDATTCTFRLKVWVCDLCINRCVHSDPLNNYVCEIYMRSKKRNKRNVCDQDWRRARD